MSFVRQGEPNVPRETMSIAEGLPPEVEADFDRLKNAMTDLNFTPDHWSKLERYLILLVRWSRRINLVSRHDLSSLATKHLGQALSMLPIVTSVPCERIMDLGSGSGLPAIPLKVALPASTFILVESRRKRANFLREVVRRLALDRIEIVNDRIENCHIGAVDLVTARAVASPPKLLDLVKNNLSPHGWVLSTLAEDCADSVSVKWNSERFGMKTTLGLFRA